MNEVVGLAAKVLTFRATREELLSVGARHLGFGLFCTWLVGMGRYWDDPKASLLQHLGVGSVAYVFGLSLVLFLVAWPLCPPDWSYRRVLTFVTLTSPPAVLYVIPVERFVDMSTASSMNAWFLLLVAVWRVALLFFFLGRFARFNYTRIFFVALLPLIVIINALAALNLEHATFQVMSGIREESPSNGAYAMVAFLSMLSMLALVPCVLAYASLVFVDQSRRIRRSRSK